MPHDHIKSLEPTFDIEIAYVDDQRPPKVLICVHGIRDNPAWAHAIKIHPGFIEEEIVVEPVNYGRVSSFAFLLGSRDEAIIADVASQISEIRKKHKNSPISIMCHSNGTKIISEALSKAEIEIEWLFLCGSVCKLSDVNNLKSVKRIPVVNELGSKDIWPILAETVRPGLYQATGVYGFFRHPVQDRQFEFGHSGALEISHVENWILPVLATGKVAFTEISLDDYVLHKPSYFRRAIASVTLFIVALLILVL